MTVKCSKGSRHVQELEVLPWGLVGKGKTRMGWICLRWRSVETWALLLWQQYQVTAVHRGHGSIPLAVFFLLSISGEESEDDSLTNVLCITVQRVLLYPLPPQINLPWEIEITFPFYTGENTSQGACGAKDTWAVDSGLGLLYIGVSPWAQADSLGPTQLKFFTVTTWVWDSESWFLSVSYDSEWFL